jgi:hypothetical protein
LEEKISESDYGDESEADGENQDDVMEIDDVRS